ncbi:hypothetical protein THRCLA_22319 [Thraustotheca clavata]|uniref:Protein kinase domain-containing protein n=1 Tax=Thraustotheca clavata TaxID=74557 RepID=A0A1V9Z5U2_9STRA|nr:hypothetical protein THRCLA_22319 [Thraustotheca clavata]
MLLSLRLTLDTLQDHHPVFSPFLTIALWVRIKQLSCYVDVPYSAEELSPLSLGGAYDIEAKTILSFGASGSVFHATHKMTQNRVAVKGFLCDYESRKAFRCELASLHILLGHPNVVNLIDAFDGKRIVLVMEVEKHGDLLSYLENHGPLTEDAAMHVMRQL